MNYKNLQKNQQSSFNLSFRVIILSIFMLVIGGAFVNAQTDGVEVSKKQIWEFLRCFNLLANDFTIQSSTHQTHILNLLKLSKTSATKTSPIEIWNTILAKSAELNLNSSSVISTIQKKLIIINYLL